MLDNQMKIRIDLKKGWISYVRNKYATVFMYIVLNNRNLQEIL